MKRLLVTVLITLAACATLPRKDSPKAPDADPVSRLREVRALATEMLAKIPKKRICETAKLITVGQFFVKRMRSIVAKVRELEFLAMRAGKSLPPEVAVAKEALGLAEFVCPPDVEVVCASAASERDCFNAVKAVIIALRSSAEALAAALK